MSKIIIFHLVYGFFNAVQRMEYMVLMGVNIYLFVVVRGLQQDIIIVTYQVQKMKLIKFPQTAVLQSEETAIYQSAGRLQKSDHSFFLSFLFSFRFLYAYFPQKNQNESCFAGFSAAVCSCPEGFFCFTGKSKDFPVKQKNQLYPITHFI